MNQEQQWGQWGVLGLVDPRVGLSGKEHQQHPEYQQFANSALYSDQEPNGVYIPSHTPRYMHTETTIGWCEDVWKTGLEEKRMVKTDTSAVKKASRLNTPI